MRNMPLRTERPSLPYRFVTTLLFGFGLVALPLAAALALAVLQMHDLASRSAIATRRAAEAGAQAAAARESLVAVERSLRQAQVLGTTSLRDAYAAHAGRIVAAVAALAEDAPAGAVHAADATEAEARVRRALAEGRAIAALDDLAALQAAVHQAIEDAERARDAEQRELVRLPQQVSAALTWLAVAALPLAMLIALGFAWRLQRPIAQLGRAMRRLGEGDLATPVTALGPREFVLLAERLEWLRRRLARLESARSRFLRSVSHDLKTPIAAIAEGAASLAEELYGSLNRIQHSVLELITDNATRLRGRIDALLAAGPAPLQPKAAAAVARVELVALVRAVLEEHRLTLERRAVAAYVQAAGPAVVVGDADALRVLIDNLVSNAVKFCRATVTIALQVQGERTTLNVCDDGPGLGAGERERIFAPGVRGAAARASGAEGSGQGLAIARDIAEWHGGRLAAAPSRLGARFVLELPHIHGQVQVQHAAA